MAGEVNKKIDSQQSLGSVVTSEGFVHLDSNIQEKVLSALSDDKEKEGGFFGKIFGIHPVNITLYFAIIIVILCLLLIIVETIHSYWVKSDINYKLLNFLLPFITTALGFVFGKGTKI